MTVSSRESIVSDRYGLVWKKSNESAATPAPDCAGLPAAGDRGEDDDENEEERDVGVRDRVADAYERTGDEDRPDRSDRHAHRVRQPALFHIHRCTFCTSRGGRR